MAWDLTGRLESPSRLRDRGPVAQGEVYALNDLVTANGFIYKCLIPHTAGSSTIPLLGNAWWFKWAAVDVPVTTERSVPHYWTSGAANNGWGNRPTAVWPKYVHFISKWNPEAALPIGVWIEGDTWTGHRDSSVYTSLEASPSGTVTP